MQWSQLPHFIALQMMLILYLIMLNIIYMQPSVYQLDIKMLLFLPIFILLIICWFLKAAGVVPCELKQSQGCTINVFSLKTMFYQWWFLPFKELVYILTQTFNLLFAISLDQKKFLFRLTTKKFTLPRIFQKYASFIHWNRNFHLSKLNITVCWVCWFMFT